MKISKITSLLEEKNISQRKESKGSKEGSKERRMNNA